MVLALLIGTWVARYLGPEKFGMLSYVTASITLFKPLLNLGLAGIVTRELVRYPEEQESLLATSAGLRLMASLLFVAVSVLLLIILESEPVYALLAFVLACSFAGRMVFEVYQYYFRSRVEAKYGVIAQIAGHLGLAISRIVFILAGAGVVCFAVGQLVGVLATSVALLIFFFRKNKALISLKDFEASRAKGLLAESWPLIFGNVFSLIYLNIDQLMLQQMLGLKQVGQYAAAVRISSLFFFLPVAISWSIQPAMVRFHQRSNEEFRKRISQLLAVFAVAGYLFAGIIVLTSNVTVSLLFGSAYQDSSYILKIHAWSLLFMFLQQPRGLWVSTESHFKFVMVGNIGAGVLNIGLNLILIPRLGTEGAAWATLVSYFFAHIGSGFFYRKARWVAFEQMKYLSLVGYLRLARAFKS